MEIVVDIFLSLLGLYLFLGLLFSIYFLARGMVKLDEGTKGTSWHFKVLIWPGTVLMWAVLVIKLRKS